MKRNSDGKEQNLETLHLTVYRVYKYVSEITFVYFGI